MQFLFLHFTILIPPKQAPEKWLSFYWMGKWKTLLSLKFLPQKVINFQRHYTMSLEEHKQSRKLCGEFLASWKLMSQPQYLLRVMYDFQSSPFCSFQSNIFSESANHISKLKTHDHRQKPQFKKKNCHSVSQWTLIVRNSVVVHLRNWIIRLNPWCNYLGSPQGPPLSKHLV